jgi:hypothetical protein
MNFSWTSSPQTHQTQDMNILKPKRQWQNRCAVRWLSPGVAWVALALAFPPIVFA